MDTSFYIHRDDEALVVDFVVEEMSGIYNSDNKELISATVNGEEITGIALTLMAETVKDGLSGVADNYSYLIPENESKETGWVKMMISPNAKFSTNIIIE